MHSLIADVEKFYKLATKNTKLFMQLQALKPQLAQAAQQVYDQWDASDEEYGDFEVGFGGICHLIADKMVDVLYNNIPDILATTVSSHYEVHVFVIAGKTTFNEDGTKHEEYYTIDIRPYHYEKGGGYNWTKIPDVIFTPDIISIDKTEPLELDEDGNIKDIY